MPIFPATSSSAFLLLFSSSWHASFILYIRKEERQICPRVFFLHYFSFFLPSSIPENISSFDEKRQQLNSLREQSFAISFDIPPFFEAIFTFAHFPQRVRLICFIFIFIFGFLLLRSLFFSLRHSFSIDVERELWRAMKIAMLFQSAHSFHFIDCIFSSTSSLHELLPLSWKRYTVMSECLFLSFIVFLPFTCLHLYSYFLYIFSAFILFSLLPLFSPFFFLYFLTFATCFRQLKSLAVFLLPAFFRPFHVILFITISWISFIMTVSSFSSS